MPFLITIIVLLIGGLIAVNYVVLSWTAEETIAFLCQIPPRNA